MKNTGDAQYTGEIKVGGQTLDAVMDTGSFELLVLSQNCSRCGTVAKLYDETSSSAHTSSGFEAEHSFGSGSTNSVEAFDTTEIGGVKVRKQMFWQVYDANMALLLENTFQAILGIGPPASAVEFAREDVEDVHKELQEMMDKGAEITEKVEGTVKHYEDLLAHAEQTTSVIANLELENMSVCLGTKSLSDGYMIWNDHSTKNHPEKFLEMKVVGDIYWSVQMTDVKLGSSSDHTLSETPLGCGASESCSAVIDTGTTLIVAPADVVESVNKAMDQWMAEGGTCDDVSKLPDLHFNLGGHAFSLPPESYVGRIEGELSAAQARYLPEVFNRRQRKEQRFGGDCEVLLMTMDMDSQDGPLWILGMPLFRKYYTSFHFKQHKSRPQAATMAFSVADDDCQPSAPAEAEEREKLLRTSRRGAELRVNASKIRVPRLVHRGKKVEASIGGKPFVRV
jgi:hypothetical protein